MSSVIEVDKLSKHFGTRVAVDELSFSVRQGEIYAFLGQNGAGKSTTIRMLLSLVRPSGGEISLLGLDLRTQRREILRQVGAVIESPNLYGYLSAYENLSLFARLSGVRVTKKKLLEQLEQVGLAERAGGKVKTFSQGMKQRLGIAVALVHDPVLIILDEPTNGLDPQGIADVRNLILDLGRRQGKTILISSHLLSEVEAIADKILIIDRGKKMKEGPVGELLHPRGMLVELQTLNPELSAQIISAGQWARFLQRRQDGLYIFALDKQQIPALATDLSAQGVQILGIQPRHSLEDYFLSLTTASQHVESFAN